MGKQRRFKKIRWPAVAKDFKEDFIKKSVNVFVFTFFILITVLLVKAFVHGSNYFRLSNVDIRGFSEPGPTSPLIEELLKAHRNKNIFDVDLKAISRNLAARYPDAKDIVLKRYLPDRLVVSFDFRLPVALIGGAKGQPIDGEGVILVNADSKALENLPVIYGVDSRYNSRLSRRLESRNAKAALGLLREIKRWRFLAPYGALRIDAYSIDELSFYLNDGIEVKIGFENLRERLSLLRNTLKDSRLVKERIKYIDVRFGDVSIGLK